MKKTRLTYKFAQIEYYDTRIRLARWLELLKLKLNLTMIKPNSNFFRINPE